MRLATIMLLAIFFTSSEGEAQSSTSNQFWSEYNFAHAFGNKWASELKFTGNFTSTEEDKSRFAVRSQFGVQGWAHYHFSSRWKFSGALAYYDAFNLPEIDQEDSKEWRMSLQGVYYFHKIGYTFNTRGRTEFRQYRVEESDNIFAFRYRQKVKYQKPLNSKSYRKGVFYLLAADEIYFRINAIENDNSFFDRNELTLGGGYVLTNDIQLELTYVNLFLPRSDGNEIINSISFTITFNNILSKIKQIRKKRKEDN